MQPTLSEIELLARQAGEILRTGFGQAHTIRHKGRIDLVTEVDGRSEEYLLGQIRARYPDHSLYAEESGQHTGASSACWYIDPLDGTTNFAHGLPIFSVSIGYAENGIVRLGVVYDPIHEEMYTAERGRGSWLNGQPLHISPTTELIDSLLVTGFPYDGWTTGRNNLDNFIRFSKLCQGVRRLGSAALDLCYVAGGRLDGYWEMYLAPYDVAAGSLVLSEAGGMVTDLQGGNAFLQPPSSILAAGPALHAQMLEVFEKKEN